MAKSIQLKVIKKGLTHEQAKEELFKNGCMITRPQWKGYHFRYFEHYCIRLANGEIIVDPEEVYNTDAKDWMIVDFYDDKKTTDEILHVISKLDHLNIC